MLLWAKSFSLYFHFHPLHYQSLEKVSFLFSLVFWWLNMIHQTWGAAAAALFLSLSLFASIAGFSLVLNKLIVFDMLCQLPIKAYIVVLLY